MRGLGKFAFACGSHLTSYQSDAAHGPRGAPWGQRWDSFLEELEIKKCYLKPCQLTLQRVKDGSLQHSTDSRYLPCLFRAQFQNSGSCPPQGPLSTPTLHPRFWTSSKLDFLRVWIGPAWHSLPCDEITNLACLLSEKQILLQGFHLEKRTRILKRRQASAKFLWTAAWVKLMFAVYLA